MQNDKRTRLYLENMPLFKDKKVLEELNINKDNLNEAPMYKTGAIFGLALAAMTLVINLVQWFGMFAHFKKTAKSEDKLAKELGAIIGSSKKWTVLSVADRDPNAFTPGRNFMIITRGLYKMLNDDEVMAVLLHEAGHNAGRHIEKQLAAIGTFALIAGQASGLIVAFTAVVMGPIGVYFALIVFFLLLTQPMQWYNVTIGRRHEYYSDSYAAKYGYGEHLISALTKLDKWVNNEMKRRPCGPDCKKQIEISKAMDEHPSLKERVENIMKTKSNIIMKSMNSAGNLKKFFLKELGVKK